MPSLVASSSSNGRSWTSQPTSALHPTSSASRDSPAHARSMPGANGQHGQPGDRSGRYSSSDDESSSPSSSPERNPTLPPPVPSTSGVRISSPHRSAGMSSPVIRESENDEDEEGDEVSVQALPSSIPRPKGKAEREREKSLGLNAGPGRKESMAKKMMRKRADSLKWAKYATTASFEVELSLSNDELRRA
ncbi:hypothetical protein JCM10212_006389 [Sporobolomyces blumeae]